MTGRVRVLYLHGLASSRSIWRAAVAVAGPAVEAEAVQLPWHNLGTGDWAHTRDPVDQLVEVLDRHPVDAVVAHSFTAGLLLEAVSRRLLAPLPAVLVGPFYRADPAEFDWATLAHHAGGFHRIFAEALHLDRPGADPGRVAAAAEVLRDRAGPYGWFRFFDTYLRTPFLDLAAVTAPQLVLVGDEDIATRPAEARALAAALPLARAEVIEGCGHFPMLQRPARFSAEVDAFLAAVTTTRHPHLEPT
ncbi:alpha/beta fold hydrolase [Actinokineospora bangkokensis]|uniref:AB hydrolase-1 domain-containing protein n=1 Tax=Actinokineospora bangkokensis TaxID=1193682 RepID=A0A1Q9LIP5_9PSEU|nr:alpha/beta hydrolase [Actinokineospora bangkokensis]OLR91927.1 hypothetical protein BJP25_24165 [Actinokineospora bangkokensis]